jgi:O-antigen/teichoic acid export membrane protein
MKQKILVFLKSELIKGSALVFAGSLLTNILNYLFHLITGKMLGPEGYAEIAALVSLMYVISFPSSIINTVVVRKVAHLSARGSDAEMRGLFQFLLRLGVGMVVGVTIFFFVFQQPIAGFLQIGNSFLVFLLGLTFAFSLISIINQAMLQGLLRFGSHSVVNIVSGIFKDTWAYLVILMGFGVLGVMWGMAATIVFTCAVSLIPLFHYLRGKVIKKHITSGSILGVLWITPALFGMSIMLNGDVMLVKHFFPALEAGQFAGLATMGKVVLFISTSITTVLLPLAVKKKEKGENTTKILLIALVTSSILSGSVVVGYFLFPEIAIRLLYDTRYLTMAPYLGWYGVYFLLYNLAYVFVYYYISLRQRFVLFIPLLCGVLQVVLIFMFHQTLHQIVTILIVTVALLFGLFLLYYLMHDQKVSVAFRHRPKL